MGTIGSSIDQQTSRFERSLSVQTCISRDIILLKRYFGRPRSSAVVDMFSICMSYAALSTIKLCHSVLKISQAFKDLLEVYSALADV